MRMAVLAGFGWTIGFILFVLPDGHEGFKLYLITIFKYLFILLNATPGLFIFVVYVCNRRVFKLYRDLFTRLIQSKYQIVKEFIRNKSQIYFNQTKYHLSKFFYKKKKSDIPTISQPVETSNNIILRQSLSEPYSQSLPAKQPVTTIRSIS